MKVQAAVLSDLASGPALGLVELPARARGQALVDVSASAINPFDLFVASGKSHLGRPELPYVPGIEGVGVVVEGDALAPGSLVRFECHPRTPVGSLAASTVVDEASTIAVPLDSPVALAAAIGVAGMAAWLSLEWRARLAPGERVVILGATGAVGQIAVQAARLLGAGRVVAAARDAEVLARVTSDAHVRLSDQSPAELAKAFADAAGGPIDVVVDALWGAYMPAILATAAPHARIVNLGESAAATSMLPSAPLRGKMVSILGYTNYLVPIADKSRAYLRLLEHARRGDIDVPHEVWPISRIGEGWRAQATSPHRKLVFTFGP